MTALLTICQAIAKKGASSEEKAASAVRNLYASKRIVEDVWG